MKHVYIIISGGCVQYVASNDAKILATVIDLDDLKEDTAAGEDTTEKVAHLDAASKLVRIW